ncbi:MULTISPECIES: response regulator [Rhodomicrobium]|uniref:response regulator n=1 Tax=Rhodomicrobium TaxID=1068 RepID=UPI000B4ADA7E|nr:MULTISPECIES: response regulator [Rhodomicrobium]
MQQTAQSLTGYRFLVIEDEMVQALRTGEMLSEMGGTVSTIAYGYEQARQALDRDNFDCAILDINLNGTLTFPIASRLRSQGTPFVFCTAYGAGLEVYPDAAETPCVNKPVKPEELRDAVLAALHGGKR